MLRRSMLASAIGILAGGVLYASVSLLTRFPSLDVPVRMAGQSWLCPPAVDPDGNISVYWRLITGSRGGLIETAFLRRVAADGSVAGPLRAVWQGRFSSLDHYSNQADGAAAAVADGRGGAFYLLGHRVLYAGSAGNPVSVRITTDRKEGLGGLRLHPDGRGNALVVWRSSAGVGAQKISASGRRLWGPRGRRLHFVADEIDRHYGRAVPDGKGGLVALLMCGAYAYNGKPRIAFYGPDGRRTRLIPFPRRIPMINDSIWEVAPDGQGGIRILHARFIRRQDTPRGQSREMRQVRLYRVDAAGRFVFDRLLSGTKPIYPKRLYLRSYRNGSAVASWQERIQPDDPDDGPDRIRINAVLLGQNGPAGSPARVEFDAKVGDNSTEDGHRDFLPAPGGIHFVIQSPDPAAPGHTAYRNGIFHRLLRPGMRYSGKTPGRALSGAEGGYHPSLVLSKGRAALVYYSSRTVSGIADMPVPIFLFPEGGTR